MPFPRCYTNEILEQVALEASRLFTLDSSVKILFVEVIPLATLLPRRSEAARTFRECWGLYHLRTKLIYVKKQGSLLKMIEVLMHEIVHAKQHKLGIIGLTTNGGLAFKNKTVLKGDWTYETMPWEIQANKHMGPMFDTFCRKANRKLLEAVREAEVRFQHQIA